MPPRTTAPRRTTPATTARRTPGRTPGTIPGTIPGTTAVTTPARTGARTTRSAAAPWHRSPSAGCAAGRRRPRP
ncbi:hypothetical protein F5972_28800 [Microbispora cellulosiformans]|uniref:Uncharacterized protein n=1 Tax=Microbispora cellulosiformans TaxID=2614688 RepID=A0A5J5JU93_9ACTN|nr:hypothetical protein F5972_28800 [Microbispora cellulosiformans]